MPFKYSPSAYETLKFSSGIAEKGLSTLQYDPKRQSACVRVDFVVKFTQVNPLSTNQVSELRVSMMT